MTTTKKALRRMMEDIKQDLMLAYDGELQSENPIDLLDYFRNALDWDYRVDATRHLCSVRVWLTLGGPDIWVDTETDSIHGAWGNDREEIYIDSELSDAILECMTLDWYCY